MKKKSLFFFSMLTSCLLLNLAAFAQNNPGTGVVTVTSNGGCVEFTPAQGNGPDNWEVNEGGSYTMTISGVTECSGNEITVFIQSSSVGNWCFNATGSNGTYTGDFTMPASACYTMPISYKCGSGQSCTHAGSYDANGQSNNQKVHLRTSFFDGNCHKTATDEDCNSCVAQINISASGNTEVCEGSCVTLTATGGVNYLWSTGEYGPSIQACESGVYSVVGVDANNCSGSSNEIEVIVNDAPTVSIEALGNTSICPGSCVTLVASGATAYLWSPNGETSTTVDACDAGFYSVVGTDNFGCSASSDPIGIIVFTPPSVEIEINGPTSVCSPNCVTLNSTGASSYLWSPNGETSESISACATGTYTVVGTDANGCTASSQSVDITVNPTPTCSLTAPTTLPVCGLGNNSLTAIITGTTTSVQWSVSSADNSWQITGGQGTSGITYKAGNSGTTGTFTLVVKNGVCESSCNVTFGSNCTEYCGYTQGFYGGKGKLCGNTTTATQAINLALASGNLVTGSGSRTVTILTSEGSCLNGKMPAGTTATSLPVGSVTCATATGSNYIYSGKLKPVLLGQVIALSINIRLQPSLGSLPLTATSFTTYGANSCNNGTAIPGTKKVFNIHQNVLNCLGASNTVNDLLALGNQALGNNIPASCATHSQINDAIDAINNGFDGCRVLAGFGSNSSWVRYMDLDEASSPLVTELSPLNIEVMPNPISDKSVIYFIAPESSNAIVEIYSINGSRVSNLYNGTVSQGMPYALEIESNQMTPGIYFVKASIGKQTAITKIVVMQK